MKKLLLILYLISFIDICHSQDTNSVKYLPLNVGNIWVYYMYGASFMGGVTSMDRYEVTGIAQANGKFYYTLAFYRRVLSGNTTYACTSRLFQSNYPLRVDSSTGNIYKNVNCNSVNESIIDSLNSKLGDSSSVCGSFQGNREVCNDTALYNIFGINRQSKGFYIQGFEGANTQRYAKNIGMVFYNYHQLMYTCTITLRGCIIDGVLYGDTSMLVGINQISSEIPEQFALSQNYPNPFNPVTKLKFQIPKSGLVKLSVYDAIGKEIQTLVNQQLSPGTYEVDFDGSNLPSSVYYYKFESGTYTETKKMVLIK